MQNTGQTKKTYTLSSTSVKTSYLNSRVETFEVINTDNRVRILRCQFQKWSACLR